MSDPGSSPTSPKPRAPARASAPARRDDERFILIPGMGADERLFRPQAEYGFRFEVPRLPIPSRGDDMAGYAARVCDILALDGPCILGGVSFGGMLACELAALCRPRCLLLIASCRSRASIPLYYWPAEWASRVIPDPVIRQRCAASSRMLAQMESLNREQHELIRAMSLDVPVPFLRGVGKMILDWRAPAPLECPVYHVHGAKDRIIPVRGVQPSEVIAGGGHLINLTHAERVNAFIAQHLQGR